MSANGHSNGQSATRFRAGIVGAGHIAEFHLQAFKRIPCVDIVGVIDLDRAKAEALAGKFRADRRRIRWRSCSPRAATSFTSLTPPHTHAPVATEALRAGATCLVEKPLATDADECVKLRDRARSLGQVGVSPFAAVRPAGPVRPRVGAGGHARRRGRGRHPARLGVSAYGGRPAAAAVPHRGLSLPRSRHPRPVRDRGVPRPDREGGRHLASRRRRREPGVQRLARAGQLQARDGSDPALVRHASRCSTRSSSRGPRACCASICS